MPAGLLHLVLWDDLGAIEKQWLYAAGGSEVNLAVLRRIDATYERLLIGRCCGDVEIGRTEEDLGGVARMDDDWLICACTGKT